MKYAKTIAHWLGLFTLLLSFSQATIPTFAASAQQSTPRSTSDASVKPIDPTELKTFMDGLLVKQMDAFQIVGATISIVQNDQIIFANGYGFANLETKMPVVADKTLFRAGSVSKLFTWTAVMQLAEQGKLDLTADINIYLRDFKVPAIYVQPITLTNLMVHNAGFEDVPLGRFARNEAALLPLATFLAEQMPKRVRPPGVLTAYSNYGAALAGYIVGQVSGMPYEQYIEDYILKPLAMQHSSFRQPLPAALLSEMATGYENEDGVYQPRSFEFVPESPAGALSSTATDMANFMIAHLAKGRLGNNRIFTEQTAMRMQTRLFTNDPRVNGFTYGFMEATVNGQRLLTHGGNTHLFHSGLVLLPEQNLGFYVSYTGTKGAAAVTDTQSALLNHYFPMPPQQNPSASTLPDASVDSKRVTGSYTMTRGNESSWQRIFSLLAATNVRMTDDGQLVLDISQATSSLSKFRYVETQPLVYISADSPASPYGKMVFQADAQGQITGMFLENFPITAFLKTAWYASPEFSFTLIGICMVLFLTVIAGSLFSLARRRPLSQSRPIPSTANWLAITGSGLSLVFIVCFISAISGSDTIYGVPSWFSVALILPRIIGLLAIAMLIGTLVVWQQRLWGRLRRLHYTAVSVAALSFTWFLLYWNFLS